MVSNPNKDSRTLGFRLQEEEKTKFMYQINKQTGAISFNKHAESSPMNIRAHF